MYKDIICGIYSIENVVNHKKYIAQSSNLNLNLVGVNIK